MALYVWKCEKCGYVQRRLLDKRPVLGLCMNDALQSYGFNNAGEVILPGPCCGTQTFVNSVSSVTKEVIDTGLQYRALERDSDAEERIKERNDLAEKPDDDII